MRGLLSLSLFLLSCQTAWAAPEHQSADSPVTSPNRMKIGAELRSEGIWSDHGFSDSASYAASPTTEVTLTNLRLSFFGDLNPLDPNIEYNFKFYLLDDNDKTRFQGYLAYRIGPFTFYLGKMKVHQGGWDQAMNSVATQVQGNYRKKMVFSPFEPMLAVSFSTMGKISLQFVEDVTTENKGQWNENNHLTPIISWFGDLGVLAPVLAYGSYDNNKSYWVDLGIKAHLGSFIGRIDTKFDSYSNKVKEAGVLKNYADKSTSISVNIEHTIDTLARPWLYVSNFDRVQYTSKVANKKDSKVNASSSNASGESIYALDDNALTVGTGVDILSLGNQWTPFVVWTTTFARFAPTNNPAASEMKTQSTLSLGCFANF
jgi:hypothetical protein